MGEIMYESIEGNDELKLKAYIGNTCGYTIFSTPSTLSDDNHSVKRETNLCNPYIETKLQEESRAN